MSKFRNLLIIVALMFGVVAAGAMAQVDELPEVDPLSVEGDIVAAGSSTVFPLAERMVEAFTDAGYTGQITVDSIGSGAGFERFCVAGETDISNASRQIRDSEIESCGQLDPAREPIEFTVGIDALAVAVSSENDFVQDVSSEELAQIFSTAVNWSDVRAEWPNEPIQRFIPGTDSGTFDTFVELVLDEDETGILAAPNTQLSEDDNVLVQGIQGSPFAIGFFGFAYVSENPGVVRAVAVDGVEPNEETAENGEYLLARPLYIYSDATIINEKPQVAAFINFFIANVNDFIGEVGYFPASQATLDRSANRLLVAQGLAEPMEDDMMDEEAIELPAVDVLAVEGDIVAAGSSTVFPLEERMVEAFTEAGYTGQITVDSIGSGAGFERFCVSGETDISNASRQIRDSEIESCGQLDPAREPIEFVVGIDALAVAVSTENDFAQDVTLDELSAIFTTAVNWSDVRAEWPNEPIQRFIPGTDSGTFDTFVELILDDDETGILAAPNTQLSEDDNVLVQGIQGSPYAIGFFGFAYVTENPDAVRAIAVDGVQPNEETAENGEYVLARRLYIYSDATILNEKPQVAAFINFFLSNVNEYIEEVGYFPASTTLLNESKQAFLDTTGMGMKDNMDMDMEDNMDMDENDNS